MIKKLIWKMKYAGIFRQRTHCMWSLCWEVATIAIAENPDWEEDGPEESVRQELYYWAEG